MHLRLALVLSTAALVAALASGVASTAAAQAPSRISDVDFHALVTGLSEPGGTFVTDNIISNEIAFQDVLPELQRREHQGAYIGVGPEQNLSYVAALKPSVAFIVDLQRGNLRLHLLYKALIELSNSRAEFMSRLFCRLRPHDLTIDTTAPALFAAYASAPFVAEVREMNLRLVFDRLTRVHGFLLTGGDQRAMAAIYQAICAGGPNLRGDFGGSPAIPSWVPSYAEMMSQTDPAGRNQSYLGSESAFLTVRQYELNNLIIPLVGDFAGGKALKGVGDYLRHRGLVVGTFYTSNVEDYLFRTDAWKRFFRNVAALPIDEESMIIRTYFTHGIEGMREYLDPIRPLLAAVDRGEVKTYDDVITRSRVPRP
jgi:hypothetical protein